MEARLARRSGAFSAAWERHFEEREERHSSHDAAAGAAVILFLFVVALRVEKQLCVLETVVHTLLVGIVLLVMLKHNDPSFAGTRNVAVAVVRLGLCASSIMAKHAVYVLQDEPMYTRPLIYMPAALFRVLIGDHTAMLGFLGAALPLGPVSNTLLQLACLCLVAAQNVELCTMPYLQGATASVMRDPLAGAVTAATLHRAGHWLRLPLLSLATSPTEQQICRWYTLGLQVVLGFLAPCLYWACKDLQAGVQHAQRAGIPPQDRLHRTYRVLYRHLCGAMPWVLGASLAVLASGLAALLLHGGRS